MIFEKDRLAVGKARYSLQNAGAFKEEDHPRGEGGQFGTGGGGEGKKTTGIKNPVKIKDMKVGDNIKTKGRGGVKGIITERGNTWVKVKSPKGEVSTHPISSFDFMDGLEISREE